jgi:ATP-dependent helicase HrpB
VKSWSIRRGLPIDAVIPSLLEALEASPSVVLQAPPGAGKSTVVPLVLLEAGWARGKRIMMLEPRRLAARAVAQRMAQTLGQSVGQTVGYRMRMDTRVSRETRIEVVTEGVLTRILQHDPALEEFAAVIFDEFHERSLQADLGLALTLDARESLSSDLRILVMSATLDGEAVARVLGGAPGANMPAPIVTAEGRLFPVESRYAGKGMPLLPGVATRTPSGAVETPEKVVTQLIHRALREESGDVLAFLPGAREIRRVQSLLQSGDLAGSVRVWPLFGELSGEEQDAALLPAPAGMRKVVLATNIAETSLTIEGVRVVVDSGLVRRSVFDASTGMSRLETQRISRASADQRQGRAGRLGPGVAYRAWSAGSQRSLAAFSPAEIVDADLVPLALELARWGARDAGGLRWLDMPPVATLASARDLLAHLGALNADGRITAHGREMGDLGVHPRLSHMLLRAREIGCLPLAADLAALLSDRDVLRGSSGSRDADITTRIDVLRGTSDVAQVDRYGLHRARNAARDLVRQVGESPGSTSTAAARGHASPGSGRREIDYAGILLAFAYPDRIGRRRAGSNGAYTLANGRGAHFDEAQSLAKHELIVAVDLDDADRDARILLAAPIDREDLEKYLPERLQRSESIEWSAREQAVIARRVVKLDEIVLEEKPLPSVPTETARAAMLLGVRELGVEALPWTRDARDLQARVEFARRYARRDAPGATTVDPGAAHPGGASWPHVSDAALTQSLEEWLAPWLDGVTRRDHLARLSMVDILRSLLSWEQQRELERLAPSHLQVPSGSNIRVDYLDESAPVVSVRLQEVFGLQETPRIGNGQVPVTFKLLSPAQRPVQVTRDLAGFWRGSYVDVRKDMRGRYPKHYWPENPLEAQATRGVRRRPQ